MEAEGQTLVVLGINLRMPFTAKKVKLKHVSLYSRQFRLAALNAGNHNVASTKQGILDLYLDQGRSGVKVFKLDMG